VNYQFDINLFEHVSGGMKRNYGFISHEWEGFYDIFNALTGKVQTALQSKDDTDFEQDIIENYHGLLTELMRSNPNIRMTEHVSGKVFVIDRFTIRKKATTKSHMFVVTISAMFL